MIFFSTSAMKTNKKENELRRITRNRQVQMGDNIPTIPHLISSN